MLGLNFGKSAEYPAPEAMIPRRHVFLPALLGLLLTIGCGQWQRVGSDTAPDPNLVVPRLFDPTPIYREMGLFAQSAPVGFVAATRFLPGPTSDSTLVVFGLSMANNALSFRREGEGFEAAYRVEVLFQRGGRVVRRIVSDETVRVGGFRETLRADESIIFQQFVTVPPDSYRVEVSLRDAYAGTASRDLRPVVVPRFGPGAVGVVPLYHLEQPRSSLDAMPMLVANPRSAIPYGLDSLRLLVEALPPTRTIRIALRTPDHEIVHEAAGALGAGTPASAVVAIAPDDLPVGELDVLVIAGTDTTRLPVLVSFSDQWAITNFEEVLSLLRYFGTDRMVSDMRAAEPEARPQLWRDFWAATDPNPLTPENEALEGYFQRVQEANRRYQEAGDPGWLTDRGEVFIVLGEPDEVFDLSSDFQSNRRVIRWGFVGERLNLDFVDDNGFGRFRLTADSRAEFQRAVQRLRRHN